MTSAQRIDPSARRNAGFADAVAAGDLPLATSMAAIEHKEVATPLARQGYGSGFSTGLFVAATSAGVLMRSPGRTAEGRRMTHAVQTPDFLRNRVGQGPISDGPDSGDQLSDPTRLDREAIVTDGGLP